MKRTRVRWLAVCVLLVATDPANAVVTGSFTGAPSTVYVSPGGAYFGPSALSTGIDTVFSPAVPPVPQPSSPPIPPIVSGKRQAEVLFLTDTTGSMSSIGSGALEIFQDAIRPMGLGGVRPAGLLADIETSAAGMFLPDMIDIRWAVAEYKDVVGSNSFVGGFAINAPFGTAASATTAIDAYPDPPITDGGGLDIPEAQFAALSSLASLWSTPVGSGGLGGAAIGDAERIIIWTGDSVAHEGFANAFVYPPLFDTLSALREQSIATYAFNVGGPTTGLDSGGGPGGSLPQATTIARATGGTVTNSITSGPLPDTTLAANIENAIIGGFPLPGDGALKEMNNITVRWDPADLGPWMMGLIERSTLAPLPLHIFDFTYPTLAPPVGSTPGNPFGFPAAWGADGLGTFLDTWSLTVGAPPFPDTRAVTFELRVDGVLIDTVEVILTNVPEPSSLATLIVAVLTVGGRRGFRRRIQQPA